MNVSQVAFSCLIILILLISLTMAAQTDVSVPMQDLSLPPIISRSSSSSSISMMYNKSDESLSIVRVDSDGNIELESPSFPDDEFSPRHTPSPSPSLTQSNRPSHHGAPAPFVSSIRRRRFATAPPHGYHASDEKTTPSASLNTTTTLSPRPSIKGGAPAYVSPPPIRPHMPGLYSNSFDRTHIKYSSQGIIYTFPLDHLHVHFKNCSVESFELPSGRLITVDQFFSFLTSYAINSGDYSSVFAPIDIFIRDAPVARTDQFAKDLSRRLASVMAINEDFRNNINSAFKILIGCEIADSSRCTIGDVLPILNDTINRINLSSANLVTVIDRYNTVPINANSIRITQSSVQPPPSLNFTSILKSLPELPSLLQTPFVDTSLFPFAYSLMMVQRLNVTAFDLFCGETNIRMRKFDTTLEEKMHLTVPAQLMSTGPSVTSTFPDSPSATTALSKVRGYFSFINLSDTIDALNHIIHAREADLPGKLTKSEKFYYYYSADPDNYPRWNPITHMFEK